MHAKTKQIVYNLFFQQLFLIRSKKIKRQISIKKKSLNIVKWYFVRYFYVQFIQIFHLLLFKHYKKKINNNVKAARFEGTIHYFVLFDLIFFFFLMIQKYKKNIFIEMSMKCAKIYTNIFRFFRS